MKDPNSELKNILRGRGLTIGSINVNNTLNNNEYTKSDQKDQNDDCFKFFTPTMYSKTIKKLNTRLEAKIGYPMNKVQQRQSQQNNSVFGFDLWNALIDLLWWIIVPTIVILLFFAIYLLWREVRHRYISYLGTNKKSMPPFTRSNGNKKFTGGTRKDIQKVQWVEVMERSTGRMYYINRTSGKVQWNRPTTSYIQYTGIDPKLNNNAGYRTFVNHKHWKNQ
jgi:hypothetical protein